MADWDIGTQVVCIKEFKESHPFLEKYPKLNQVLTIREAESFEDKLFLRFFELINETFVYGTEYREVCFNSAHFRPVRKTDISSLIEVADKLPNKKELMKEIEQRELEDA